jgi:hypothetical protein
MDQKGADVGGGGEVLSGESFVVGGDGASRFQGHADKRTGFLQI